VTRVGAGIALAAAVAVFGAGARAQESRAATPDAAARNATGTKEKKRKGKGKKTAAAAPKRQAIPGERVEALRAALLGPDEVASQDAARALGSSGAIGAAEPLVALLAMGTSPTRTQAALDALTQLAEAGALGVDNRAVEVLDLYAGHRSPDLRKRAIKALGTVRDPKAADVVVPVLLARLGDGAPDVRAAAGEALAARRESKASARLYALVKRGDPGAAAPLAALAAPDLVPQIAELAGTVDDGVLATVLGEYVKRDDVPDKLRVDVLRTIGGLAGAGATTALVEYVASVPAKDNRPSKKEAQKLLDERGDK
jgi:HEAT repeat protein